MTTFVVTREPIGYGSLDQQTGNRHVANVNLDTRRREGSFARLLRLDDGQDPVEIAHVRHGLTYEGMSSRVDWADTVQVVDAWERAKQEIRDRLDYPKMTPEFEQVIDDVIKSMGLPCQWLERLRKVMSEEIEYLRSPLNMI